MAEIILDYERIWGERILDSDFISQFNSSIAAVMFHEGQ